MGEGDAGEGLGRVRVDADPRPGRRERSQGGARLGAGAEVDRRAVLGEALEGDAPVADAGLGPAVEFLRGDGPILGERVRVEGRDGGEAARRVGQEVVPELPRVPESIQVNRDRPNDRDAAQREKRRTPAITPTVSISQSTGEPWRPETKAWCTSSVTA